MFIRKYITFIVTFLLLTLFLPYSVSGIDNENFTTYTEVDPNSRITVTADTITVASLSSDEAAYVYFNKGLHFFAGARVRLKTKITAADNTDGTTAGVILGITEDVGEQTIWSDGYNLNWVWNGTNYFLQLRHAPSGTVDNSTGLSINTDYYVELRQYAHIVKVFIYSDSDFTTSVDTLEVTDWNEYDNWRYIYAIASIDSDRPNSNISYIVADMQVYTYSLNRYASLNEFLSADEEQTFESYPFTGWTEDIGTGATLEQSSVWSKYGSNSLHIVGITAEGATLYKDITSGSKNNWEASAYVKIVSVADGSKADLIYARDNGATKIAGAAVRNSSGTYYWQLWSYNGSSWASTDSDADFPFELDTEYHVRLHYRDFGGVLEGVSLWVDGRLAVEISGSFIKDDYPERIGAGKFGGTLNYEHEVYIDQLVWHKEKTATFGALDKAPNGDLVVATHYKSHHSFDSTSIAKTMTSSDEGVTWENEQTIDISDTEEYIGTGVVTHEGAVYLFLTKRTVLTDYTGFTEVDPNSRISTTIPRVTLSSLQRDENAYLYYDYGVDFFDGDFIQHLTVRGNSTGTDDSAQSAIWGMSNNLDDFNTQKGNSQDFLSVFLTNSAGGITSIVLREIDGGSQYQDIYVGSDDTVYYLRIERDESVGTYGTIYCDVYTTKEDRRTESSAAANLSVTLHSSKKDFRYLYGASSWNTGQTLKFSGYGEDLEFGYLFDETVVYKSTNNGQSWSLISGVSLADGQFKPSRTFDGTKILGVNWKNDLVTLPNSVADFVTYDTNGDTFSTVSTIATYNDIAGRLPTEGYIYRRPSDSKLIAFNLWPQGSATLQYFPAYQISDDDGATWNAAVSLQSKWGYKGGRVRLNIVGNDLYATGALRDTTLSPIRSTSWVAQVDPDDFEVIQEFRWFTGTKFQEDGNGESILGGGDVASGNYFLYLHLGAGSASFYKLLLPTTILGQPMRKRWQHIPFMGGGLN